MSQFPDQTTAYKTLLGNIIAGTGGAAGMAGRVMLAAPGLGAGNMPSPSVEKTKPLSFETSGVIETVLRSRSRTYVT